MCGLEAVDYTLGNSTCSVRHDTSKDTSDGIGNNALKVVNLGVEIQVVTNFGRHDVQQGDLFARDSDYS